LYLLLQFLNFCHTITSRNIYSIPIIRSHEGPTAGISDGSRPSAWMPWQLGETPSCCPSQGQVTSKRVARLQSMNTSFSCYHLMPNDRHHRRL
jgi:hypothetical protein